MQLLGQHRPAQQALSAHVALLDRLVALQEQCRAHSSLGRQFEAIQIMSAGHVSDSVSGDAFELGASLRSAAESPRPPIPEHVVDEATVAALAERQPQLVAGDVLDVVVADEVGLLPRGAQRLGHVLEGPPAPRPGIGAAPTQQPLAVRASRSRCANHSDRSSASERRRAARGPIVNASAACSVSSRWDRRRPER